MSKFEYVTLYDLMDSFWDSSLSGYAIDYSNTFMHEFIQIKTNNFDSYKFKLFIIDLRNYIFKMDFCLLSELENTPEPPKDLFSINWNEEKPNLLANVKFEDDLNFRQRIDYLRSIEIGVSVNDAYNRCLEFTDIAEELFYNTIHSDKNEENAIPLITPKKVLLIHNNNRHNKFRTNYNEECLTRIMKLLIQKGFLINTDIDDWLYWFNIKPINSPKKLIWEGTPTMLANVIQQICLICSPSAVISAFGIKPVKPTKPKYINTTIFKEIEQIILVTKQKKD